MNAARAAFRQQAVACTELGSPFTARLCTLTAERLLPGTPVADRVLDWPGNPSHHADALPLRLAGALHALVLEGRDPVLARVYPPHETDDDTLWRAVDAALAADADFILSRLEGPPQTNETMRSAALAPGLLTVAERTGLPLVTSELGASAGLNMVWDRFAYHFGAARRGAASSGVVIAPDWRGPPPPDIAPRVIERAGCDRAPARLESEADRLRLLSFVWADQAARMERLEAAIALTRAEGIGVDRADAADWLAGRLARPRPGAAHVVCHSIFWQYLDAARQARVRGLLDAAGARATTAAPLAWLRMEADGEPPGAAVTLTLWPGGETRCLGRADFHGRWILWTGWTP